MRRAASSAVRLLSRELQAEGVSSTRQFSKIAARVTTCAPSFFGSSSQSRTASPVETGNWRSTRHFSDIEAYSGIFYPDNECEVGGPAPEFKAPAVVDGEFKDISLSDYRGKYVILFWYPKDFTFVCPTEIIAFSDRAKEFEAHNCQLIAASTDTPEVHLAWIKTARNRGGLGHMQIPILADVTKEIAARYGVLKRDVGIALRGLYIINPEGVVEHITMNNFPVGRNVDEALRTLQAIQYVAEHGEVCPAGWKPGDKTMVADPEKSLDYFATVGKTNKVDDENFGANLVKINDKKDLESLIASGNKVAIKFWAPWCNKCRMISPYVDELQEQYPGVTVASFDTTEEKLENVAADMGVKGLPQFRFFKDGKEVLDKIMGYKKQPLETAMQKLNGM